MIRKAIQKDAPSVAALIVQAMPDLAMKFTNATDTKKALSLFEKFFRLENNQYSYTNTLVYVENEQIYGSLTAYDGTLLNGLREPFFNYIKATYQLSDLKMEEETTAGEFYLDTISVSPKMQGKGIGKQLILAAIQWAKAEGHQQVGLLVDEDNSHAKRLYERLGFIVQNKKNLLGKSYEHLVFDLTQI